MSPGLYLAHYSTVVNECTTCFNISNSSPFSLLNVFEFHMMERTAIIPIRAVTI